MTDLVVADGDVLHMGVRGGRGAGGITVTAGPTAPASVPSPTEALESLADGVAERVLSALEQKVAAAAASGWMHATLAAEVRAAAAAQREAAAELRRQLVAAAAAAGAAAARAEAAEAEARRASAAAEHLAGEVQALRERLDRAMIACGVSPDDVSEAEQQRQWQWQGEEGRAEGAPEAASSDPWVGAVGAPAEPGPAALPLPLVTPANVHLGLRVVRGPGWSLGSKDGGGGGDGVVVELLGDELVRVEWEVTGGWTYHHISGPEAAGDLCVHPAEVEVELSSRECRA
ncbi:hypothetical protein GPECTOR_30g162 [Gonium pectorale]|uniref:MIB/HERC2 domain-containing protein n=1 Tax=Gonium pectorale TaxID=33097 RepID=A0A150GDZ8_GONPE|nr:hypothetical protein GPECTOR_30g162 [Gonium pectorale]|eukprot:KXZ48067.1 hypothetical protein GPECTOR_30g162 [Gonium pectorale]